MNAPTYVCLQKKNIAPVTFTQWLAEDSHVYIGTNLSKYTRNPEVEDEWGHLDLDRQLFRNPQKVPQQCQLHPGFMRQLYLAVKNYGNQRLSKSSKKYHFACKGFTTAILKLDHVKIKCPDGN